MFDPINFAMNMISQNPRIANNPQAKQYIDVIRSGDNVKGQQLANNILNSYGISKEQAIEDIKRGFNLPF